MTSYIEWKKSNRIGLRSLQKASQVRKVQKKTLNHGESFFNESEK